METDRLATLMIGERTLSLPVYFPSISSVKTALRPTDYMRVLFSLIKLNNQFLVSAYDLAAAENPEATVEMLRAASNANAFILMDSGNYESFWKDAQATWTRDAFHEVLRAFPYDAAFAFDEQEPPANTAEHAALVVSRLHKDQATAGNRTIIPIIHGAVEELPELCTMVAGATGVAILAVPERRLGDGVLARARTVAAIRCELDKQGRYIALHLLGTGNPISIAIYALSGADSFDGLEWCQTVVDFDTALLFHLSQFDFFQQQSEWADAGLSFHAQALAHNLEFYTNWMRLLHASIHNGTAVDFCRFNFPNGVFRRCSEELGWTT